MTEAERDAHERGLAAFLAPSRRERFLDALKRRGARAKLAGELYHYEARLDPAVSERLAMTTKHDGFVAEVVARLRLRRGARRGGGRGGDVRERGG